VHTCIGIVIGTYLGQTYQNLFRLRTYTIGINEVLKKSGSTKLYEAAGRQTKWVFIIRDLGSLLFKHWEKRAALRGLLESTLKIKEASIGRLLTVLVYAEVFGT